MKKRGRPKKEKARTGDSTQMKHPLLKAFGDLMMKQCGDILSKPVLEYLHWD